MINALSAKELTNKKMLEDAVKFEELAEEFLAFVESEIRESALQGNNYIGLFKKAHDVSDKIFNIFHPDTIAKYFLTLGYNVEWESRRDGVCMTISW